uniref:Putative PD-(D/E)XK nuclease superfamily protein n=1 Tax=viral metagenome TaxID=1070528 RepID=A0A6M3LB35_9ZZZZ
MKITNDLNIPEHAFAAICRHQGRLDPPTLDYIGVTTLMGEPLPRYLKARHWAELEIKASETMNAMQGQMGHLLFAGAQTDTETEIHLETEFEGVTIKGIADYYDPKLFTLGDAKFKQVNAVTATNIRGYDKLETQLNIYCWMARRMGYDVQHLQGDIYINGWTVYKAFGDSAYPKAPYVKLSIPIWEEAFTANYVSERLRVHNTRAIFLLRDFGTKLPERDEEIRLLLDSAMLKIPICTDEERFMQPTKYAVMKEGQKKAVKLCDKLEDALLYIAAQPSTALKAKLSVTERKGGYMRCGFYCGVRNFCVHNKKTLDNQNEVV